jgi:outer membrane protein OmpA-like peptidoglycan-associated protein
MQVTFTSTSLDPRAPDTNGKPRKLELSLSLAGAMGKISSKRLPDLDFSSPAIKDYQASSFGLQHDVHFCLDSALLTEDARQALRIMLATELPAFESKTSHVTVFGHTDRVASDAYNLRLSELRAKNVEQAIKDVLGTRLAAPIFAKGLGEVSARLDPADIHPPSRRVDVLVNARLVLSLRAL